MQTLILKFGLLMVFLGTALEGDVTMILSGVVAHLGLLPLPAVLTCGALGGLAGDLACYALGRRHAASIRGSRLYRRAGPSIEQLADRIGARQILVARFVYGTRMASMIFWGVRGLSLPRFALIDLAGCLLWAVGLGVSGYLLSDSAALLVGDVKRVEIWLLAALIGAVTLIGGIHLLLARRRARRNGTVGPA
jgi:membrane protein DedA with SNARE-associated domain